MGNGFRWEVDTATKTMRIFGEGVLGIWANGEANELQGANHPDWKAFAGSIDTIIIGDGITKIGYCCHSDGADASIFGSYVKNILIGKDLENAICLTGAAYFSYQVDPENPFLSAHEDALYAKDLKTLYAHPTMKADIALHPAVERIDDFAFQNFHRFYADEKLVGGLPKISTPKEPFVIPWGVMKLGNWIFRDADSRISIVLPDSIDYIGIADTVSPNYIYSQNLTGLRERGDGKSEGAVASVADYYEIKPNSWQTFGGKKYYFDSNREMLKGVQKIDGVTYYFNVQTGILEDTPSPDRKPLASGNTDGWQFIGDEYLYYKAGKPLTMGWVQSENKWYYIKNGRFVTGFLTIHNQKYYLDQNGVMLTGFNSIDGKAYYFEESSGRMEHSKWKLIQGNWYYLNTYGAGMVKYWALSGGKWFYLKEDGKMAKSQWIEWYNKWYYVGSDGAMYVNRSTPDGRYVDGSGVRVR